MIDPNELSSIPWIADLPEAVVRDLSRCVRVESVRQERTLYYQEDRASTAMLVIQGRVRHVKWTDTGATLLVRHAYPGDWCGLAEACRRGVYLTDATTSGPSRIAIVHGRDLIEMMRHQAFRDRIVGDLAGGYYTLHGILQANSPRSSIVRYLAFLSDRADVCADHGIIKITQEEIAQAVGLTRETVHKHLHQLAESKAIEMSRGAIRIADRRRLRAAINEDDASGR